jgi:hypothetical protein
MTDSNTEPDWIVQTVTLVANSFEQLHGNAFVFLSDELKNAMLFKSCFSPTVISQWDTPELIRLSAVASSWYPRP